MNRTVPSMSPLLNAAYAARSSAVAFSICWDLNKYFPPVLGDSPTTLRLKGAQWRLIRYMNLSHSGAIRLTADSHLKAAA